MNGGRGWVAGGGLYLSITVWSIYESKKGWS